MHALALDFRRAPYSRWIGLAVLAGAFLAAAGLALEHRRIQLETGALETQLRALGPRQRRPVHLPVAAADGQQLALELRQAREVALQLGMPWDELFRNVEAADAPTVALLGVESTADRQRIQISAEAKNLDAMLGYLQDLERRAFFANVFLNSHQIQQQDPQHPVRFMLSATWQAPRQGTRQEAIP